MAQTPRRCILPRPSKRAFVAALIVCLCAYLPVLALVSKGAGANVPPMTLGPNVCGECHKQEVLAWKQSHHFKTFREMPRRRRAKDISKKMGVRRVKSESLCLNCHFTVQKKNDKSRPIAGISCESCHGQGLKWVKVHSSYSGKKADTESKAEEKARWKKADANGMIRPSALYQLAKNCYGCHVVPNEKLVNKGGHRAGSPFDMVSWSQGEVRHNTWHSKGKDNVVANASRRRMLFIVGLGVELETSLRALAKATLRSVYAFEMASRVDRARRQLAAAAKALPKVPEIAELVRQAHSAGLKLGNQSALTGAADGVSRLVISIAKKYDGAAFAGIDRLILGPKKYRGKVYQSSGAN